MLDLNVAGMPCVKALVSGTVVRTLLCERRFEFVFAQVVGPKRPLNLDTRYEVRRRRRTFSRNDRREGCFAQVE